MEEVEKMLHAKKYIDQLANGINPLTGEAVAEDDIVNNVRLSRCFFYVSDLLRSMIEAGGRPRKRARRIKFCIAQTKWTCTNIRQFLLT